MTRSLVTVLACTLLCAVSWAQPRLLKDIRPGGLGSSNQLVSTGKLAFFSADDGKIGRTLWRTNGSSIGTFHLKTQRLDPKWLMPAGDKVFFANGWGSRRDELWVSDGTPNGTKLVYPRTATNRVDKVTGFVASHDGLVYFTAWGRFNNQYSHRLFASDGTPAGTVRLTSYNARTRVSAWRSTALGKHLYFLKEQQLWRTDGTVAGTKLVYGQRGWNLQAPHVAWKGRVWCEVVRNGKFEIWTSDGTTAGTKLFRVGRTLRTLTPSGDLMYFSFNPSGSTARPSEIWKTDGTVKGTKLVTSKVTIYSKTDGSPSVAIAGNRIVFAGLVNSRVHPWVSDGTAQGTLQLTPTPMAQTVLQFDYNVTRIGDGSIAALHCTGASGREIWITDGTPQKTRLAFDVYPGRGGGVPSWPIVRAGENFVFLGNNGKTGLEPWAITLEWFGASFLESYGHGCAGANGVPILSGTGGAPRIGNPKFALELTRARRNSIAVLLVNGKTTNINLGNGCPLLVDLAGAILEGHAVDANGVARVPLPVPNNPRLIGNNIYWQFVVIDSQGALLRKFAMSNGLRTLVGQ